MAFINDYKDVKNKVRTDITQSQLIFDETLARSGFSASNPQIQYANIYTILAARDSVYADLKAAGIKEDVSVTGSVTEMICKIALDAAVPGRYAKLPTTWSWIGDFAIMGSPFNLFVSVKSYKAKERLIVSGTGQNAAPVIGYGLFNDKREWSMSRVKQYKQRGFVAIYLPNALYNTLDAMTPNNTAYTKRQRSRFASQGYPATKVLNIYDKPLLRKLEDFSNDLSRVCVPGTYTLDLSEF